MLPAFNQSLYLLLISYFVIYTRQMLTLLNVLFFTEFSLHKKALSDVLVLYLSGIIAKYRVHYQQRIDLVGCGW